MTIETQESLLSHLTELRSRLIKSLLCTALVFMALVSFSQDIYLILAEPLMQYLPADQKMIAIEVASPLVIPLKVTLLVAVFICIPFLLYQAWAFIAPGLYQHERRLALPLVISSSVLFYLGCVFAYFIVLPSVFHFFASVVPEGIAMTTDISRYLDFVLTIFFAFGFAFEIPVAIFLLISTGTVSIQILTSIRPYILIAAFIVGMLFTPPDVFSQVLLAIPVYLLYECGLLCARLLKRQTT